MNVAFVDLWLPTMLSGVAVFIVSCLIRIWAQYHNSEWPKARGDLDWKELPNQNAARVALQEADPGQYALPYPADNNTRRHPKWQANRNGGPAVMVLVMRHSSMASRLALWFLACLVMSVVVAIHTHSKLAAGAGYSEVVAESALVACLAYTSYAFIGSSHWFGHTWGRTTKDLVDAVIYGFVTSAIFGWLWP